MTPDQDPLADWPDRTPLLDQDGRPLLVFTVTSGTRAGRRWADGVWRPSDVPPDEAAKAALDAFAGWAFSTADPELAARVEDAGATELRHAHTMSHDLTSLVPVTDDPRLRVAPLSPAQLERHALRLGAISFAAYPPGHPDHSHDLDQAAVSEVRAIARGEILGPMLAESRVALAAHQIVGACLVVHRDGTPPDAGPWVIELFRDPASDVKGVGRSLLSAVLAESKANGLPAVSLAVSHDNHRAVRLYRELGFADRMESWTFLLPTRVTASSVSRGTA